VITEAVTVEEQAIARRTGRRMIVNVATDHHVRAQDRLVRSFKGMCPMVAMTALPEGCPEHSRVPYAFKAYALKEVADTGAVDTVLWLDASIIPGPAPLDLLWQRIEHFGYWISRNGFRNSEWTANSAYQYLGVTREQNENIEHVVAGAMGFDLRHEIARKFLAEYYRLATNGAFCGPWRGGKGVQHRHDQTAASVIAWKLGMELTNPPEWFAYKGGEMDKTVLVAAGAL
jgi:hypothetical protein